ncbi:PREDICTED: T-cell antigen CD7 isoform X2 [Chinchilla lanigera]|uniref:T-cell antigen CD7 isoform X2 n=1 Tax=Chinchilla lanigera TaxID=34839 RepID=UPI00038EE25A|nr:PREDICTED: T-cell antigen CD7 isoform X2 [Chinchilla lanigera]
MAQLILFTLLFLLAGALPMAPMAQEVQQSPLHIVVSVGDSVNITCSTSRPLKGLFLNLSWPRRTEVIYYEDKVNATVDQKFWGRISFMGSQNNLTITMSLLQVADSGIYTCFPVTYPGLSGPGTMVMVTELCQETQEPYKHQEYRLMFPILPWALAGGCFFLGLGLGMSFALRTQIRKSCASRDKNPTYVVYEDMSCISRNALSPPIGASEPLRPSVSLHPTKPSTPSTHTQAAVAGTVLPGTPQMDRAPPPGSLPAQPTPW